MNSLFLRSEGSRYYTIRRDQATSPSQTFLWGEENMWLLSGLSEWVLNDNALHVSSNPDTPIDTFGSFHKISTAKLAIQQRTGKYNEGVANILMLDGSLRGLPPTEACRYRGHVR